MKRRRMNRGKNSGAPKWMVTYSDMITLILVFFILLFSMSQIDSTKFEAISDSFRNRMILDFYPSSIPMEHPSENSAQMANKDIQKEMKSAKFINEMKSKQENSLDKLMKDVKGYLDKNDLNNVISANRTERGVVLVLQESILFDTAKADILDPGKEFLEKIGSLLAEIPNNVRVEGHTDSRPIASYTYPSNWELSGARASSVTRYLINNHDLDVARFSIAGYGDTNPVEPNTTGENMSKNRRVEIVILEDGEGSNVD